jgi:isopentenyl-diphosphate delta-isomerase type 1
MNNKKNSFSNKVANNSNKITNNSKDTNRQIIDNQKEVFEIVDKKGNIIGQASRKDCHQNNNLIHQAAAVIIFNQKKELLVQQRSFKKDLYPNCFTFSASGHLNLGETFVQAAIREVKEELGINISQKDLVFAGKLLIQSPAETELSFLFFCFYNQLININFNKAEIKKISWLKLDQLLEMVNKKEIEITPGFNCFLTNKDLVKKLNNYPFK